MQLAQRLRDTADDELVTPLETFVAAAHREPNFAEEFDRADEAAQAEVDEETPSSAQQRQLLRAHVNLGHPTIGKCCRALRYGRCRRKTSRWVKRYFKCPECEARPMLRTRPAAASPTCYRFNQVCGIETMEVRNPFDREKPIRISHFTCLGTRYHQETRRQDMTVTETFSTLRQFLFKHYDAMEVLIMDQRTEFGADFQHLYQSWGILHVVTDLETPWQNPVVERHGALFKMAFEKTCSLEAPTTEAAVNELIDFTFAELNRRVGRVGCSPGQRVFGRQLRLPSSLLEDDFIEPYTISKDATHEMRRNEAMRMAAAHGCVVADRRAMSTAPHSRQRKPQRVLVAGERVFIHRRKNGAQEWCGPGVYVLNEEPKPGRNETVWVHMRNCLHKCYRTQVRPATNEEAEGIETVTSLLPILTEAVREGRT